MNMREMTIGVIGGGVVGQATACCYLEHVKEVCVADVRTVRSTHSLGGVLKCDLIFVCLPTPQKAGMGLDCSALDDFFKGTFPGPFGEYGELENHTNANFVLRSTVPIGTTRRLRDQYGLTNLVHSPEFLTARCAMTDAMIPARNIIGCDMSIDYFDGCASVLSSLYMSRFPGTPVILMTSDESESVKLMQNGYFAAQVSLWNELRSLADKLGLAWDVIRSALLADPRVSQQGSQVPGHDGKCGWGGACLPKDVSQLLAHFHEAKLPASVLDAVWERNWDVDRREEQR